MKRLFLTLFLAGIGIAQADEELLRNPFWPQGYEGKRQPITLTPRFKTEARASARTSARARQQAAGTNGVSRAATVDQARKQASEAALAAENELWTKARKTLSFGSVMNFETAGKLRTTITINRRIYGEGDFVSASVGEERFTWRIKSLSNDGKIKLERIRHTPLENLEKKNRNN